MLRMSEIPDNYHKESLEREDVVANVTGEQHEFPKYTTQILNTANQNAQGTRPKVVGQISELRQECPENTYEGWEEWYLERNPEAIERAVDRIDSMVRKMKKGMEQIDRRMIREWVQDLVLKKSVEGLIFQEAILKHLADKYEEPWEPGNPQDESKNIDGFIGGNPVSIKPKTYLSKDPTVRDDIQVPIIYYRATATYLHIYTPVELEKKLEGS